MVFWFHDYSLINPKDTDLDTKCSAANLLCHRGFGKDFYLKVRIYPKVYKTSYTNPFYKNQEECRNFWAILTHA